LSIKLGDKFYKFELLDKKDNYDFKLYFVTYIVTHKDNVRCTLQNSVTLKHRISLLDIDKIKEEYGTNMEEAFRLFEEECDWRIKDYYDKINEYKDKLYEALEITLKSVNLK